MCRWWCWASQGFFVFWGYTQKRLFRSRFRVCHPTRRRDDAHTDRSRGAPSFSRSPVRPPQVEALRAASSALAGEEVLLLTSELVQYAQRLYADTWQRAVQQQGGGGAGLLLHVSAPNSNPDLS